MKDNASKDAGVTLRRAAQMGVHAVDLKDADGDKKERRPSLDKAGWVR